MTVPCLNVGRSQVLWYVLLHVMFFVSVLCVFVLLSMLEAFDLVEGSYLLRMF